MVVVTDDRLDADRLDLVQKALRHRGGRVYGLDPRIRHAKARSVRGRYPDRKAGDKQARKPRWPSGQAPFGNHGIP